MRVRRKELLVLVSLIVLTLLSVLIVNLFVKEKTNEQEKKKVDIEGIVAKIKEKYGEPIFESKEIADIISLIFTDEAGTKFNIIIDKETGTELQFEKLINNEEEFEKKELELLNLKYPEFVVKGLTDTEGEKTYFVKEHEILVTYDKYTFDYELSEDVTLTINDNEIKEFINFHPVFDEEYELEDGFKYRKDKKTVAFSFDDGPTRAYNEYFLEALNKNKAHATFFMVGTMMNSCNECVVNTYNSGNEIGSHTYEHMNMKTNSIANVANSLAKVNNIYNKLTNDNIKLLRPPYGSYSSTNLANTSVPFIIWDLDTEDWRYRDKEHIVNYIKNNVHDGGIILMHELYYSTLEAVREILPWLYANGYQVVSVSELASLKDRTLESGKSYYSFR